MTHTNKDEVLAALEAWHLQDGTALLDHLLLVQAARKEKSAENNPLAHRAITNGLLLDAIAHTKQNNKHYPTLLEKRFMDEQTNEEVAAEMGFSLPYFYKLRRGALNALVDQLNSQEVALRQERIGKLHSSLRSLRSDNLFGAQGLHDDILTELRRPDGAAQVCITGIGGIGKTTRTVAILRELAGDLIYDHYIWAMIDAPLLGNQTNCVAQVMSDIRRYLSDEGMGLADEVGIKHWFRQNRVLLIVDNVEEKRDAAELLAKFHPWLGSSRMLMNSRAVTTQTHLFERRLDELESADSYAFIRHLAAKAEKKVLASADDATIHPIYERTGGNPLAIELVVGLLKHLPLAAVLADLPKANFSEVDVTYSRIYQHVWLNLSENAQKLFKMMPLIGSRGATPEHMQRVTKLEETSFWDALIELTSHSLLIQKGNELNPRYAIHRISEQFLKVEVIRWHKR